MHLANETLVKNTIDELMFFFAEQLGNLLGHHVSAFEKAFVESRVEQGREGPAAVATIVEEARSGSIASHKALLILGDELIHVGALQDYFRDLYLERIKAPNRRGPARDWSS